MESSAGAAAQRVAVSAGSKLRPPKHPRRDMQTPPQCCMLDAMPKEIFDKIMSYLTPKPSSRPFEVMDRGLPVNELDLDNDKWKDIAKGMSAMACLARAAKRYHALVTPFLYENVLLPVRTSKGNEAIRFLLGLYTQLGRDTRRLTDQMYRGIQREYDCGGLSLASLLASWRSHKSDWKHTARLDLRGGIESNGPGLIDLLVKMPQLRELALQTSRMVLEAHELGHALRRMRKLKKLSFVLLDEMYEVLYALASIEARLEWLSLECHLSGGDGIGHCHFPHSGPHLFPPKRPVHISSVHSSCSNTASVVQLFKQLDLSQLRQLSLPRIADGVSSSTRLVSMISHTRLTSLDVDLRYDVAALSSLTANQTALRQLSLRSGHFLNSNAVEMLIKVLPPVETLALPASDPGMLLCILGAVKYGSLQGAELPRTLRTLVVGRTNQQLRANHWPSRWKLRVARLNFDLEQACRKKGITFVACDDDLSWKAWIEGPRFVAGKHQPGLQEPASVVDFYETWKVCHSRPDDDFLQEISAALSANPDAHIDAFVEQRRCLLRADLAVQDLKGRYEGQPW